MNESIQCTCELRRLKNSKTYYPSCYRSYNLLICIIYVSFRMLCSL